MSQPQDSGAQRPFCRGPGCSFYGDAVTGYCSVCAKKNNVASVAQAPVPATTSLLSPPKGTKEKKYMGGHMICKCLCVTWVIILLENMLKR